MTAAPASGQLLVGKVDRAVGRAGAGGFKRVGIGGIGERREMELAGKEGVSERGCERRQIEDGLGHGVDWGLTHPAAMLMEMSAARAEWVSAPTLMKSTPVSA